MAGFRCGVRLYGRRRRNRRARVREFQRSLCTRRNCRPFHPSGLGLRQDGKREFRCNGICLVASRIGNAVFYRRLRGLFFHLTDMEGSVEHAKLSYIIRDHDREKFEARKAVLEKAAREIDRRYGSGTVKLTIRDSYYNMEGENRALHVPRRSGEKRHAGARHCPEGTTDPRRNGRRAALVRRASLPESLCGR